MSSQSVTCSICMANYEIDGEDFVSIKCGHCYHRDCLLRWRTCSKKSECPECRQKFTSKTLKKLFLHTLPNDDECFQELQQEKRKREKLVIEMEVLRAEKRKCEDNLVQAHIQFCNMAEKVKRLSEEYELKCKEQDVSSVMNEEYLRINNQLQAEKRQLQFQNEKLLNENVNLKLKATKPFVDLTADDDTDDDSDVEIIETAKKPEEPEIPKTPDITKIEKTEEVVEDPPVEKPPKEVPERIENLDFKGFTMYQDFEYLLEQN